MIFLATSWKLIFESARKPRAAVAEGASNAEAQLDPRQVEVSEAPAHCTHAGEVPAHATRSDLLAMKNARGARQ